jgi:rare lipoprotein A
MAPFWTVTTAVFSLCVVSSGWAADTPPAAPAANQEVQRLASLPPIVPHNTRIDHSGRKEKGRLSYYSQHFNNRKMADGKRFNPDSNVAASKTLPLGTTAKVTNLQNGKSATVQVEDRGPFVDGRVVDVTPKVANELDMQKQGVAPVVVAPIAVPQPNGEVKLGAGAADADPHEVEMAVQQATAAAR